MSRMSDFLKKWSDRRSSTRREQRARSAFSIEPMEARLLLSVTAVFSPITDALMVLGDTQSNTIEISRDEGGNILVNGGDVRIMGGTPTVDNTSVIQIVGQAGDDVILLNEANGALPRAEIFGGAGDDQLSSGSGDDLLFGQAGSDILFGGGNKDLLAGGAGDDFLLGGDGNDRDFGQAGDDQMVWNPGDDSDVNDGGSGADTVEVNGGAASETFTVTPDGGRVRFERTNPAPFVIDIGSSEGLIINANAGDDSISAAGNFGGTLQIREDGGAGNDTLIGGDGNDLLEGGDGNDFIDGNQGHDIAFLGDGDDIFQWDPGDGSDGVDGGAGTDDLIFNGSDDSEGIHISDNNGFVSFTRNIGGITMNLDAIELIDFNALGGGDSITVDDLSGTDAEIVRLNLAAPGGGGDGDVDTVIVNGTDNGDTIDIAGEGPNYVIFGRPTLIGVAASEAADLLIVNALGGDDFVSADTLPAATVRLVVDGGTGADSITGGTGRDLLIGGDGKDFIDGRQGNDVVNLGTGDDVFRWNPGDGSDSVLGDEGTDLLVFNGNGLDENITVSGSIDRVLLTRDVGGVRMDLNQIELLEVSALGGADTITVNALAGTGLTEVNLNLASGDGIGDLQPDTVIINGSDGDDDTAFVSGDATGVTIFGLTPLVNIAATEPSNDRLILNGLAGDDVLDATDLAAGAIQFIADGGDGDDIVLGSPGDDVLLGGPGNDFVSGADGVDVVDGGPGDNIEIQ